VRLRVRTVVSQSREGEEHHKGESESSGEGFGRKLTDFT